MKEPRTRAADTRTPELGDFRGRHLRTAERQMSTEFGQATVTIDESESPLAWLARRRGRNGRALIELHQFHAGERLRADFTCAHMMPRTTSNWGGTIASGSRRGGETAAMFTDTMVAARQRVRCALDAAGPEFSGLLLDVCCFLKRLEDVERERNWPVRSAKIVLQLGLDCLARHYGYAAQVAGPVHAPIRTWLADGEAFRVG